jgi:hypothetical protein
VSDQATALGPKFFVLGAFVQASWMMDTWKARGINTLVEAPQGHDVLQWAQAADSAGLYQIRHASSDLHFDVNDPHLLAWATQDEPSNTTSTLDYGVVSEDPAEVAQEAAPWRAAAQAEGKFVPVWTNHVAGHIYPDWAQTNVLMHDYMQGAESDWLSADSYPIQEHQPFVLQSNDGYTSTTQGITLDRQAAWSGGKPVMAFIGTSAYSDSNAVPTASQFNAMAWSSVIHGATGITYFPVDLSPWSFDATPPDLVQAMTTFDQEIASIDKILMNETAGGRDPFTIFRSANPGVAPHDGQLPYPFEATEIQTEQGPYRIILNLSDQDQVLNKPEWGLSNVTFHAYEVHKGYAEVAAPPPPPPPPAPTPTFTGADFTGGAKNDTIIGNDLDNRISGKGGADTINGGAGADRIDGGAGADQLWGGSGNDTFVFGSVSDAKGDQVMDFSTGDVIDLSAIDARSSTKANDAFAFIGDKAFSGIGQLHVRQDVAAGVTYVEGNINSDPAADFSIAVKGLHTFIAGDFVL